MLLYRNLQTAPSTAAVEETSKSRDDGVPRRESLRDEQRLNDAVAASAEDDASPTDDVLGDYTQPEDDRTPTRTTAPSPPADIQPVPEPTPATDVVRPVTPPLQTRRSMDEDAPLTPIAATRLSRARPMSQGHRERLNEDGVLADGGESTLKRAGSGEARAVRGPRGARGPRPGPGKLGSVDLTASPSTPAGRPGSPSIKDRIAHLESRAGSGTDRFV